ncbi:MAG: ABC transporter substrate-binding protein [bacterium]|nr:ABC transporter substrate-binding protein [bacterium]
MRSFKNSRFPTFSQWTKLTRILSSKERGALLVLLVLFSGSLLYLISYAYGAYTVVVPSAGGRLTEGMVGSPRFLNPVYSEVNDADRSLVQLLFSGLLRYDNTGKLISDLASDYAVLEGGRIFEVNLREDARWHDGYAFDADDVLFTVQTIQDPRYKSPVRANWVGVDIQKMSSHKIRFLLKDPFAGFPERLTLKILPKHIWQDITPENFALSSYNLQPVGTGPYRLTDLKRSKSGAVEEIRLKTHTRYHLQGPYISELMFKFFVTEQELAKEAEAGKIQSFAASSFNPERLRNPALQTYEYPMPRSYSLFFNLEGNSPVTQQGVREALALAIDREEMNQEVFLKRATPVVSPLRPDLFSFEGPEIPEKDLAQALVLLKEEGYQLAESGNLVEARTTSDFASDLRRGNQGAEVTALQECLAQDTQVYPEGIINGVFGPATEAAVKRFQETYASDVLAPSGLSSGTGTVGPSTRAKLQELCSAPKEDAPLKLQLTTLDQSPLKEVALFLASSFKELGITTEVILLPSGELERDVLKPRNFTMLLFGEILATVPDPLPFWHSSQAKDPGLNLSGYDNSSADTLLEQIRRASEEEARTGFLQQLQGLLLEDLPAIALYDLPFTYVVSKEVKGIRGQLLSEPSQRFSGILDWYIKTKRTLR